MALPARQRAAFEVIEAEFVLEFLILLFDRPALMREPHERARATRSRADGRGSTWCAAWRRRSRSASSQTSGARCRRRHACAGVTRWAAKRAVHARAAGALRHVIDRHAAAGQVATSVATEHGVCPAGKIGVVRRASAAPRDGGRPGERGRADEDAERRRNAHRVRQSRRDATRRAAWNCRQIPHPPRTAVIRKPAARTCRNNVSAWRHFSWNRTVAGIRARVRASGVSHACGRYNCAPEQPRLRARPQRDGRRHLAIRNLAERAAVLPRHADRLVALFRKAGPVEDQHAFARRHALAQLRQSRRPPTAPT